MHLLGTKIQDESGSVLAIAALFMIILTLIGTSAMNTSTFEQQIAANYKFHKIAFQNSDSGIFTLPKVITACLDEGNENISATAPGIFFRNPPGWSLSNSSDGTFFREMMGFDNRDNPTDMRMVIDNNPVEVDISNLGSVILEGGGAEFGTGAEGAGSGTSGSKAVLYGEASRGFGPSDSLTEITAVYRKILDVPGGL